MSSALEAQPRLRPDLTIVRREHQGRVHFVVKEPTEQKYYKFGETEVGLMRLMDGRRTPAEIAHAASSTLGITPTPGSVADFAHRLKRLGLVERTPAEQHLMLMERLRSTRKVRARGRAKGTLLRLTYSIGDPDRLFDWIVARARWLWSPAFIGISLVFFAAYLVVIVTHWREFVAGTAGLYTLSGFTLWDWVLVYVIFLVIGGIHEFGHGLTTKYFGGEVHEIGAMLLYFSPALFCNTNDAWTFEKRAHRLWVTFAGPWIQLIIAAIAAVLWVVTEPTTFLHRLAFLSVLVGGIAAVLANVNPLIPLDGYYALSDWLEIPNLRGRAFEYWGWLFKRYCLGVSAAEPKVTPRERRVFLIYGGLALVYSTLLAIVSFYWLVAIFGRLIGPWIWVLVAVLAIRMVGRATGRARALAAAAATSWRAGFLSSRRAALVGVVLAALAALPFLLPWTLRARGEFRVEAASHATVRAEVGGVLDRLYVADRDTVQAGDSLARLWNPALQAALLERAAEAERLAIARNRAETRGDLAAASAAAAALADARDELSVLRSQRDRLVLQAPIDGVVMADRLRERLGAALQEGDSLLHLASSAGRVARVRLPPTAAGEVAAGQHVSLKLPARPDIEFQSRVTAVAPAVEDGWLEAEIRLPRRGWQPDPGMTGTAKIATRRMTLAGAFGRVLKRTFRLDLWL